MFQEVKVAAISFVPEKFALQKNADRLEVMYRKAAAGGAQLALAPEGVLEGYVVNEIIAGDVPAARMNEAAISIRSPVIGRFRALARELDMCLAFGFAERIGRDVFNCAAFIDQQGRLCGKYHKMQLAEGSHRSWWFNRLGRRSRACNTPFGRCGFSDLQRPLERRYSTDPRPRRGAVSAHTLMGFPIPRSGPGSAGSGAGKRRADCRGERGSHPHYQQGRDRQSVPPGKHCDLRHDRSASRGFIRQSRSA